MMRFDMAALAAALLLAPLARGTARADEAAADPVIAQRGSVVLKASDVRDMLANADPPVRAQMEHDPAVLAQKVRERLMQLVLLDEAKSRGWDQRPDVAYHAELARQGAIEESWITSQVAGDPNFPTDEQVQAAYDQNKSKLMVPRQFHLAQIFVAVPANASKQVDEDAQHKLAELRQQAVKAHGDFAALAKQSSDDKASAPNGGDMGWLREDTLIPPIRSSVAGLAEGAVSEPLRSPQGWHIVKLLGTRPAAPATLAEARETLVRAMRQERLVQGERSYLANLVQKEPIQLNEIELGKLTTK
jgi:peptidylprolyl isomerase